MTFILTKAAQAAAGKLSYMCPWCLVPTSSGTKMAVDRGHESFHTVECGHAACAKPSLVRVRHQHTAWVFVQTGDGSQVEGYPPALPSYVKDGVPSNIARDFTEALRCQASGFPLAASLVGRRVLQAAVQNRGGRGNNLKEEIESLDPNLLPDLYKKQAHEVRFVGNAAAHAEDVSKDEVEDLIGFTRQVLQHLYVMPEQVRVAEERRQAKRTQAAKKKE